jgi:uncharacterized membrane protein YbhN (UPF0104 family)
MSRAAGSSRRLRFIAIAVRLLVAIACIFLVIRISDTAAIWHAISTLDGKSLAVALALHAVIIVVLARRWMVLIHSLGSGIDYTAALRMTFVSTVLNLTLPTSVGGDVGRVLLGRQQGVTLMSGSAAAILDRLVGLLSLIVMVIASTLLVGSYIAQVAVAGTLLIAMILLVVVVKWARSRPTAHTAGQFVRTMDTVLKNWRAMYETLALSFAAHLLAALIAAVIANGMDLSLSFWHAALYFPAVLLAAAIPVSIGGWGLRELAAIPALAQAGLGAESAAAVAFVFGLTQLVSASVGALVCSLPIFRRDSR